MDCWQRDRSTLRGNNRVNYEGTRTRSPSSPTYLSTPGDLSVPRSGSDGNSRRKFVGKLVGNTCLYSRADFRSITRNTEDPGRKSVEAAAARGHSGTSIGHASRKIIGVYHRGHRVQLPRGLAATIVPHRCDRGARNFSAERTEICALVSCI